MASKTTTNPAGKRSGSDRPESLAPVQGNDAIEILENDHVRIKELLADLVAAGEHDEGTALLEELKALLTIHTATEENLVYPAVRVLAKRPAESDKLYHQQDEAKVAVWELDALVEAGDDFAAQAEKLQSAVLAHIRKEEETEFPHLRSSVDADGLRELTAKVREFRTSLHFTPSRG
jgi:hemerythrin superfamily protein